MPSQLYLQGRKAGVKMSWLFPFIGVRYCGLFSPVMCIEYYLCNNSLAFYSFNHDNPSLPYSR